MMEPTYLDTEKDVANNNMLTRRYKKMTDNDKTSTYGKLQIGMTVLFQTYFYDKDNIKTLEKVFKNGTKTLHTQILCHNQMHN